MFIFARLNKIHGALLALVMIIQPSLHATEDALPNTQENNHTPKPETMLVYMTRDNDLSDFGTHGINEIMATTNSQANTLAYGCHNSNDKKVAPKKLILQKIMALNNTADVDSDNENALPKALLWALQEYPSAQISLLP